MRKLTTNEQAVLDFLIKNKGWHSPTEIGGIVGGKTYSGRIRHSSWACPILKRLVAEGLVIKDNAVKGYYKWKENQPCKRERER